MSRAYTIYPAKPTYGNYSKKLSGTDIIANKRTNAIYCNCNRKKKASAYSQSELLAIRKITSANCKTGCNVLPFDKTELEVNLITELYLQDIIVLSANANPGVPSKINPALVPIFAYYTIDPSNNLTGDTPCGIQKFTNYMILNTNIGGFTNPSNTSDDIFPSC